jgi:glycosyl transferase, family 25
MTARAGEERRGASSTAAAFEFLNGWAERIFVISLERATERRANLRERLAGLRYELSPAVDKLTLDRERLVREGVFDESRTPTAFRHRAEMPLGQIGCALSHRAVYEEMVRSGCERAVVFEDDVVPLERALGLLPAALRQLPAGWELCYLGYTLCEEPRLRDRVKQLAYVLLSPLPLVRWRPGEALRLLPRPFSANLRRAGRHMCAHAYAVTLEAARKLIAAQTPIAFHADQLLPFLILRGRLEAYVTTPIFFDQEWFAGVDLVGAPASYIRE